jgi:AcrR family transcriptional regulator
MVLGFFVAYLERQIELGALKPHDPQTSARAFFGPLVVYVLGREVFLPLKEGLPDKERYAEDAVDIFLNGLRTEGDPRG